MFDLVANNGEELNFVIKDDSKSPTDFNKYEVTNSDREIRLKPHIVSIFGGNFTLPREIKLGDIISALYGAYSGNKGKDRIAQGRFMVSYDYGTSGRITYIFCSDEIDNTNTLEQVSIEWYDAFDW
jgi:hypothetical protein